MADGLPWLCRIFGHKWSGRIAGFRYMDGMAIGPCARCEMPILDARTFAAEPLRQDLREYAERELQSMRNGANPSP